jgi:DNA polymerase delta subunit 4
MGVFRESDANYVFLQPCIGIARLKRWKRANMLGLNPPIEVLAVLLKELDAGEVKSQRAHVDELMSSRFIET